MSESAMQIEADDTFLGTSIQFSEQEILRLEREHAAQVEQTVEELIRSGFLDTDYEDSDTESISESEVCGEYKEHEIYDDVSSSLSLERAEEHQMERSICYDRIDSLSTQCEDSVSLDRHDSVDSVSDRPVIDEHFTASNSGVINDAEYSPNAPISTTQSDDDEIEDDDDDMDEMGDDDQSHIELMDCRSVRSAMDIILREFGSIALILLLFVIVPHIVHQEEEASTNNPVDGNRHFHCQTRIIQHWIPSLNEQNEDEHEEREEDVEQQGRIWNVGIRTTAFDYDTNTVYQCQHEIRIDDLFQSDEMSYPSRMAVHFEAPRRVFVHGGALGAGLSGSSPMMRIFKETVSVQGRHFVRNHGLTALVMSFAGIAAITAANSGLDELL